MPEAWLVEFPWDTLGVGGLATLVVWFVMTGRLVPKATVDRMREDYQERIRWMESTAANRDATTNTLVEQNAQLSAQGELSLALLKALQMPGTASGNTSGSGHVASTQE